MGIIELLRDIGVFGLAMWTIQWLLTKSANRKFEIFKSEINNKAREYQGMIDSKLELYKSELHLQNYKSTQVYERQLNVIIDLHIKLNQLNMAMQAMTAFIKTVKEDYEKEDEKRIQNAATAYNEFLIFYQENLIFIPENTVSQLDKIRDDYFESLSDYTLAKEIDGDKKFKFEKLKESYVRVQQEITPSVNQLVKDFRHLIGVEMNF